MLQMRQAVFLLAGRAHDWLASRAASACAACKHSCKQSANHSCQKFVLCARAPALLRLFYLAESAVSSVLIQMLMMCMMHEHAYVTQIEYEV